MSPEPPAASEAVEVVTGLDARVDVPLDESRGPEQRRRFTQSCRHWESCASSDRNFSASMHPRITHIPAATLEQRAGRFRAGSGPEPHPWSRPWPRPHIYPAHSVRGPAIRPDADSCRYSACCCCNDFRAWSPGNRRNAPWASTSSPCWPTSAPAICWGRCWTWGHQSRREGSRIKVRSWPLTFSTFGSADCIQRLFMSLVCSIFLSLTCCERDAINILLDIVLKIFTFKYLQQNKRKFMKNCKSNHVWTKETVT